MFVDLLNILVVESDFEGLDIKEIIVCEVLCDVMVEEMCWDENVFFMGEEVVEY